MNLHRMRSSFLSDQEPKRRRMQMMLSLGLAVIAATFLITVRAAAASATSSSPSNIGLRIATFDVDATPPLGSHLAYDPVTNIWDLTLRARGIVILGKDAPIVLCAVDWIGIANEGHDAFRESLAQAAGTSPARVAVHTLHQHDAPDCDFGAEKLLRDAGVDPRNFDGTFARELIRRTANAVRNALPIATPVTHIGTGQADVKEVASNRRVKGPDGKIRTRYTATKDPTLRAEPEGTIDPKVSLISFWNQDQPITVLSYYATHPQSYYRTGVPSPDFPGMARFFRQLEMPNVLHVHFNGAGGNIGAGKYNDGSHSNRVVLARRLEDGMRRAWSNTQKREITTGEVGWGVQQVTLPPARHLKVDQLQAQLTGRNATFFLQGGASKLAWLNRCLAGKTIDVTCLSLGNSRILHLPGELFVEYQLSAKAMRPDLFVAMAAYGDYGPGYIGTTIAYSEGGYETQPDSSNVAPEVEDVLLGAIRALLKPTP